MVRHGRNRKRRAGRIGRTKLKNRNYAKFKPPQINDMVVKSKWDPAKSPSINMANLGLQTKLNDAVVQTPSSSSFLPSSDDTEKSVESKKESSSNVAIELFDIPESDTLTAIPAKTKRLRMLPVSIEDQKFIIKCIEKYGIDDYDAMVRDIKVNDMQYTKGKLKKMVARFLLLEEHQLRVDVAEDVLKLMRKK